MNSSSPSQDKDTQRSCTDCRTTTTPLWRSGPAGPRSLCNACGIRYRKKRRDLLGLNKGEEKRRRKNKKKTMKSSGSKLGVSLNQLGLMAIQRGITAFEESMLKEEEQAAIMLMALSSESFHIFA
ncbi:GATA transcription factor 15 [Ziziphus jujuba]|uniref:GATA transcription factor 15 n=1 Tax=Ziziphus jujuba TaxID=326968 RepID=A0A6P4AS07_ZIZJJ|nr:GATA transcription factor 15 [Ziziphus jujuba]